MKCTNCGKESCNGVDCFYFEYMPVPYKEPGVLEFDEKNQVIDLFVREDKDCPFPFHENDWYHQGFTIREFIIILREFFEKHKLPFVVEEVK